MPRPLPRPRPTCLLKNATRFDGKSQQSYDDDNDDDDDAAADMVYEVLLL